MDDFHRSHPDWYLLLKEHAKDMRKYPTDAEAFLWRWLKGKALGVGFKRQCVILDFIADFYCPEKELVIEIDGGYHNNTKQIRWDEARSQQLEEKGYRILRFTNEQVLSDIENVIITIKNNIQ